jgi:serpin B
MHKTVIILAAVAAAASSTSADEPIQGITAAAVEKVVAGNNLFAAGLYQKLCGGDENLFFSPYSISTALAMAYAGARDSTEAQMARALCFPTSPEVVRELPVSGETMTQAEFTETFGALIKHLNARGGDAFELRVANALWGQENYAFLESYQQIAESAYGGRLQELDFRGATEQARQTINTWVERQTNDKIRNLIQRGVLGPLTRLVLTNAIYFKGNWASQFDPAETRDEPFTLPDDTKIQVPMMHQEEEFGYAETSTLQVLEMPYVGRTLSMVVLLPKRTDGLGTLEADLNAENLSRWLASVRRRKVVVAMPRFEMTHKTSLERVLNSMGMREAFGRNADFSGMTGGRDLFISAVVHQAYIDVNEEGTEAAAATGVVIRTTSVGPDRTPVFRADHPFVFVIRDRQTGSILFLGRTMNPRGD